MEVKKGAEAQAEAEAAAVLLVEELTKELAEVRAKALYAASALQRSHALGRRQFELAGGVHALVGARWPPM